MFEKLSSVEERYEDISTRLSDPAVISDNEKYRSLMKEYKNLTPIVEKYREYRQGLVPPMRRQPSCWRRAVWTGISGRSSRSSTGRARRRWTAPARS